MRFRLAVLLAFVLFNLAVPALANVVRDIGGDGKIGLEEAVHALQVAAGIRSDDPGIGLASAIQALQIMTGNIPQGKRFPGSLSLFGSGLVFMAGAARLRENALRKKARLISWLCSWESLPRNSLRITQTKHAPC